MGKYGLTSGIYVLADVNKVEGFNGIVSDKRGLERCNRIRRAAEKALVKT